jgi:hypothetical protein
MLMNVKIREFVGKEVTVQRTHTVHITFELERKYFYQLG